MGGYWYVLSLFEMNCKADMVYKVTPCSNDL